MRELVQHSPGVASHEKCANVQTGQVLRKLLHLYLHSLHTVFPCEVLRMGPLKTTSLPPARSGIGLTRLSSIAALFITLAVGGTAAPLHAQSSEAAKPPTITANWTLAKRFNSQTLNSALYSTSVQPRWLGKTDSLWYNWRDASGTTFYLAVPALKLKRPLFDHVKLAAELSTLSRKAADANKLPFSNITFTTDHKAFRFNLDSTRYEWNLAAESLKSLGTIKADSILPDEERPPAGGGGGGGGFGGGNQDFRNFSPDSSAFVFARDHNLFLVNVGQSDTIQITTDGEKDYSFGFRDTTQLQQLTDSARRAAGARANDPRVRANVTWSPDSRAFFIIRTDSRKVGELYLVNVLAQPRPTLSSYRYAMPGEANVPQQELNVYERGDKTLKLVNVAKWQDQRLMNVHWTTGSSSLRLVRRDRPQRNLELIEVDLSGGATRTLIAESIEQASLDPLPVSYVKRGGDFVWWSERSGWAQLYLYAFDGTLKRPLTTGAWHVDRVADVDTIGGSIWLEGMGREAGENPYLRHMYRVNADGSGFTLLDPGQWNHTETLSPTKRYAVDNYSGVDYFPRSVIRDARTGNVVMSLETMDSTELVTRGFRFPEPFVVKAADGVTDIYGNLWKPVDFDSTRKYPIIAHVYPGPQTESVNTTFSGSAGEQELAQLGFIVIQIGNRGGSPLRSVAYHRFGYGNARDYALADKKAGIEQLSARYPWIDIDKVGIYGHSGGGFLTATALMLPPYNDFFKVGVSSSGNHDNNIYNQNWSEWNYGVKVASGANGGAGAARNGRAGSGSGSGVAAGTSGAAGSARDSSRTQDSVRFDIKVPTTTELARNLKGNLLLTTGDMDNNVHPGNTIRLVNALILANKRFDFMLMPGKAHGYANMQSYFNRMMMEYFARHLLGDQSALGATYDYP